MPTPLFDSLCLFILTVSFRLLLYLVWIFQKSLKINTINSKIDLFCKNLLWKFTCLHLIQGLRLSIFRNFYMPTFIQEPTFIRYFRVCHCDFSDWVKCTKWQIAKWKLHSWYQSCSYVFHELVKIIVKVNWWQALLE